MGRKQMVWCTERHVFANDNTWYKSVGLRMSGLIYIFNQNELHFRGQFVLVSYGNKLNEVANDHCLLVVCVLKACTWCRDIVRFIVNMVVTSSMALGVGGSTPHNTEGITQTCSRLHSKHNLLRAEYGSPLEIGTSPVVIAMKPICQGLL